MHFKYFIVYDFHLLYVYYTYIFLYIDYYKFPNPKKITAEFKELYYASVYMRQLEICVCIFPLILCLVALFFID